MFKAAVVFCRHAFSKATRKANNSKKRLEDVPVTLNTKESPIAGSVLHYLSKVKKEEVLLNQEKESFYLGRRYLAKIMDVDEESMNQNLIDEAIQYLFPSGLFGKVARPIMKPPEQIFPRMKPLQCNMNGRPYHWLFYTRTPQFYELMLLVSLKLETLKVEEDLRNRQKELGEDVAVRLDPLQLVSSKWISKKELEKLLNEKIHFPCFKMLLSMLKRMASHPLAALENDFIMKYRVLTMEKSEISTPVEHSWSTTLSKYYVEAYGQRKRALASLTLYKPGTGQITVNNESLFEVFPTIGDREQIMFPLQYTGLIKSVDIVANVSGGGMSGQAGALRLAISRGLTSFLDETSRENLRLAGLLTQDMRFHEKKKPGQPGARKKPIWKAR